MSQTSLGAFLGFLLSLAPPLAATPADAPGAPTGIAGKLTFTYPCALAYENGQPYADPDTHKPLTAWECDYLHASVGTTPGNGASYFNSLSPLARQKAVLADIISSADDAHDKYLKGVEELLRETDPAKIPRSLHGQARDARLQELSVLLSTRIVAIAKPFLWPRRQDDSYVEKTNGDWPSSWKPYTAPIEARDTQLAKLREQTEVSMAQAMNARAQQRLNRLRRLDLTTQASMERAYDGTAPGERDGGAAVAVGRRSAPRASPRHSPAAPGASDLKAPAPPIPLDADSWNTRNYFSRGTKQGAQRLRDEATVAVWHALGLTRTIGAPDVDARYIVQQKGPSCAVGAQYEAMKARGMEVDIARLAQEASEKGYFTDYSLVNGDRAGGTDSSHLNSLLIDHGVLGSKVLEKATPAQLLASIRKGGGAIVTVHTKLFWDDPSVGDGETHAIYITGAEVDKHGVARGYYVNDTGTGEGRRFISAAAFKKAWLKEMVSLPPKTVTPRAPDLAVPPALPPAAAVPKTGS